MVSRKKELKMEVEIKSVLSFQPKATSPLKVDFSRLISTQEVASALRPFYFVVHPDLFGQFPQQRATNEDSLQRLSAHLEALQQQRILKSTPKKLPFFVRERTTEGKASEQQKGTFKLIEVPMEHSLDTKIVIKRILEACQLPTETVDRIRGMKPDFGAIYYAQRVQERENQQQRRKKKTATGEEQDEESPFATEFEIFKAKIRKTKDNESLTSWVEQNREEATKRALSMLELRSEVEKLKETIARRLELQDIVYDCGWNVEHFRGCLKSLEKVADLHAGELDNLKGRTLVFASFTGVSLEGDIMLFTGDVTRNWLDLIKKIPQHDVFLKRIPAYEHALSQVLRHIRVARRKFMPKAMAQNYTNHLRKGQFIVPATLSGSLLVDFISQHLDQAHQRKEAYNKHKYVERDLERRCLSELDLKSLTKDDSVTPERMIDCCERLLAEGLYMKNLQLHITNYYSVLSDGTVCVPWDWKK